MSGEVIVELTSADIPVALDIITNNGIIISDMQKVSALSVRLRIQRQDFDRIQAICEKRGDSVSQILRIGLYWKLQEYSRHWVLVIGLMMILVLTALIPTRVFFFRVEGNTRISTRQVLEEASRCGICFGAERSEVRSERMKNSLLESIPQLQWAAVNTYGCVAVISVEERQLPVEKGITEDGDMIANRDGIILEITAAGGTAMVRPGQAVRAGDVLISGYTDCGGVILRQGADGEVFGRTLREISARTDENMFSRGAEVRMEQKFSLILGKKRINFYEDSGILDAGCVKMYSEYCLSLPGGFVLPVKLRVETQRHGDLTEDRFEQGALDSLLSDQVGHYLQTQMIAGSVLSARTSTDGCRYFGEFICREMIGRMVYEEIVTDYGENR